MSVYRLVTEGTVEERLILRAEKKLYLDRMVMGRHTLAANAGTEMVRFVRAPRTPDLDAAALTLWPAPVAARAAVAQRDPVDADVRRGPHLPRPGTGGRE